MNLTLPPRRPTLGRPGITRLGTTALIALAVLPRAASAQEPPVQEPPAPEAPAGPTLEEMIEADLQSGATGLVAGVVVDGELDFLDAWGTTGADATDSLEVTSLLAYPGLTEILVSVTIRALGDAGLLDPTAPISSFLPGTEGRLGRVTLAQLVSHTSGLDDAEPAPGQDWSAALDALDDDAFVAEPGEVFSASRYSFPLAVRVLERAVRMPFPEIASQAVLTPLGMGRSTFDLEEARTLGLVTGYALDEAGPVEVEPTATFDGLPVLYTAAPDVLQFLSAWMTGGIRGASPVGTAPADVVRMDVTRLFGDGVMQDTAALRSQAWINHEGAGFGSAIHLYPEAATALFVWSNGPVPGNTLFLLRRAVAEAVGDVETAMASQGVPVSRAIDPAARPTGLDDLAEWHGLYRNGAALLGLRFSGDQLWLYDGRRDLPLQGVAPATFAYRGATGTGPPLQLVQLGDRRLLLFQNRAYAWESAEVPETGGDYQPNNPTP